MKRNNKLKFLLIICIFSSFISSCSSGIDLGAIDDSSVNIDESLVTPVGEISMTVKDIINQMGMPKGVDTAQNEIFFYWKFRETTDFNTLNLADSIKPFDKIVIPINYATTGIIPAGFLTIIPVNDAFDLGVNAAVTNQRVDSIKINSSQIKVNFNVSDDLKNIPASDFSLEFVFPGNKIIVADGTNPTHTPTAYNKDEYLSIGKYTMYIDGLKTLPYTMNVRLKPQATPITITSSSRIYINMRFSDINYSVAYGYFNLSSISKRTVKIPFNFTDYLPDNGELKFANPIVELTDSTNIGANMYVNLDYLNAFNDSDPSKKIWALFNGTHSKLDSINGPLKYGNWTHKKFEPLNAINGQTNQLFDREPYPNMLDYNYAISNNNTVRKDNFITPDGKIISNIMIMLPLKIRGGANYTFSDSINNFSIGSLLDNVDMAILKLTLKNALPVRARYRMTFWKSNMANDTIPAIGGPIITVTDNTVAGNMFSEYLVKAPGVTEDGVVIDNQITPQVIQIKLNKVQAEALKQTKFIIFHVFLDTDKKLVNGVETPNPLHITLNNSFGVSLGLFVKGNLSTNIGTSN